MTIKAQDAPGKPIYEQQHGALPLWLWASPRISLAAKNVLALLEYHRNAETGQCNPKIKTLARELVVSPRTIKNALRELRDAKLITITWGQRSSNYTVAPVADWLKILKGKNCPSETNPEGQRLPYSKGKYCPSEPPASLLNVLKGTYCSFSAAAVDKGSSTGQTQNHPHAAAAATPENTSSLNERRAQALINALLRTHPQPGLPRRAVTVALEILRTAKNPEKRAARIQAAHVRWCEYWAASTTKIFIPQLWRWLSDGDFEHPPNDDAIAARKKPVQERRKSRLEEAIDNA